uniref:thioredoxin family protein n=1 Tax=Alistipes putredinis TaxID=28117 RepID=UPI003FD7555C
MEIKVLGTGCAGWRTLYETVTQAIAELGISAAIVKEEDIAEILSYGIMTLPGLVVDGRVVSAGRKLSLAEVKELLNR